MRNTNVQQCSPVPPFLTIATTSEWSDSRAQRDSRRPLASRQEFWPLGDFSTMRARFSPLRGCAEERSSKGRRRRRGEADRKGPRSTPRFRQSTTFPKTAFPSSSSDHMTYTHASAPFGFGFAEWDILGDDVPAVMGLLHPSEDLMRRDVPHDGEVLRGMLRPRAAGVLPEDDVKRPVQLVLDPPVRPLLDQCQIAQQCPPLTPVFTIMPMQWWHWSRMVDTGEQC